MWSYWDPRLPDGCTDEDVSGEELEVVDTCVQCGGDICAGDEVYEVDDGLCHEECLDDYARKRFDVVVAE